MNKVNGFCMALLSFGAQLCAQAGGGPANIASTLYASNFAQWTVAKGNNGPFTWSSPAVCAGATSGGVTFQPFVVGVPIRIVDTATPSNSENVTVLQVSLTGSGCSITVHPASLHYSFYLTSATAGLQEAINYSKQTLGTSNPASVVIVTPAWSNAGGTTAMITGASGSTTIPILDERSSVLIPYLWNGSVYVAQPFATSVTEAQIIATLSPQAQSVVCFAGPTSGSGAVTCRQLDQDDILPGFSITGFVGGSTVEIGSTVTNPTFTASYSNTPTSATISNTDGIDSPLSLVSPFTSGTVVGSFVHASAATTVFTLTAQGTSTKTATQATNWKPRSFGGVGAAGATGATASGTSAVLTGATGTLGSVGLTNSNVGATYGPLAPSSQKIYLLLIGGSHTFKDAVTGFAFAFNSPTSVSFVNVNGDTVAMYLYESTNLLTGTYSILVAS